MIVSPNLFCTAASGLETLCHKLINRPELRRALARSAPPDKLIGTAGQRYVKAITAHATRQFTDVYWVFDIREFLL